MLLTGQQPAGGPYTAEQATAGKTAHTKPTALLSRLRSDGCASARRRGVHRRLAHAHHARHVRTHSPTMPADNPGGLSENTYANIVAYILQYNGVAAGTTPLTPTTDVRIGGPVSGAAAAPAAAPARGAARSAAPAAGASGTRRRRSRRSRGWWTRTRAGATAHRSHRERRSEELRARHRRDAAQSGAGRLADAPARSVRLELQPAHADHARQRAGSSAAVGLADERGRHESAVTARAQRHDLPQQHRRHHPGARRQDRRSDLGAASRRQHPRCAA